MGRTRCPAPQLDTDGASSNGGITSKARLGDVYRSRYRSARRTERTDRVHLVGCIRSQEEGTDRYGPAQRDRVAAPVSAVSSPWILRVKALLKNQRGVAWTRARPDRLDALSEARQTRPARVQPRSTRSQTADPRSPLHQTRTNRRETAASG